MKLQSRRKRPTERSSLFILGTFSDKKPSMSVGKGIGKIYQQTAIETYSNVGFAKLYSEKTAVTAADLLNGRVLPFFDQYETLSLLEYSLTVGQNIAGEKKKSLSIIPLLKRD